MSSAKLYGGEVLIVFNPERHTYSISVPKLNIKKLWNPGVSGILSSMSKGDALINWAAGQVQLYARQKLAETVTGDTISVQDVDHILTEAGECWRTLSSATTIGSFVHRNFQAEMAYLAGVTTERPSRTLTADSILQPDVTQEMLDTANVSLGAVQEFFAQHKIEPIFIERILFSPTHGFVGTADCICKMDGVLSCLDLKTSKGIYPEYWLQTAAYSCAAMEEFPGRVIQERWIINAKKDGGLDIEKRDLGTYAEDLGAFLACNEIYRWKRANDKYRPGSPIQVLGPLDFTV